MAKKITKKGLKVSKKPAKAAHKKSIARLAPAKTKAPNKPLPRIMPLGDRVLVRPFTEEEVQGRAHFGIILPEEVSKEKSAEGIVLAVGEGKIVDGKLRPMSVSVGDRVIFSKYGYDEVKDGEIELYILKEDALLAIINK